jgi:hypothetical protein
LDPVPFFWLAIDVITSTKTKIGAMDFKPLINRAPKKLTDEAPCGHTLAKTTPAIIAATI